MMPPLFIVAPPRSFTSVVCAMLGCHPEAFGLAEINLFAGDTVAEMQDLYDVRPRLAHGLLRTISEIAFAEQTEESIETVRLWLRDNRGLSTIELFLTIQEWIGDKVLIDKSPLNVYFPESLQRIEKHMPDARFLHLTRHPGDTVKSVLGVQQKLRGMESERSQIVPVRQRQAPKTYWLTPHLHILEFLESVPIDRQMRLRGEDLLSDPENYLRQIAEWLGIRTDAEAIGAMLHPEESPFSKYGPDNARLGNDPNFMEKPQLRPYSYEPHPLTWTNADGEEQELDETVRAYAMMFGY